MKSPGTSELRMSGRISSMDVAVLVPHLVGMFN
jgi:hypothetical protein